MQLKDQALASYDTIVEDAKDIYAEAKSKKEAKQEIVISYFLGDKRM